MAEGEVTRLIVAVRQGDEGASAALFERVYHELRQLAGRQMRGERKDHTLQATALVHEAFVRLTADEHLSFENRAHFFGVATAVMRRTLIDHARAVRAKKRGSGQARLSIEDAFEAMVGETPEYWLDLDQALDRLAALDARQARIVELRFFGGLSLEEVSDVLGVATRTVDRDWKIARGWLRRQLGSHAF
jgi:RNA polymerase sigma-70 factor, ECF subfamily